MAAKASHGLQRFARGLMIAGFLTGVLSALSGSLAYFTVSAHTNQAHQLMYWHRGIRATSLLFIAWPTWDRWRKGEGLPTGVSRTPVAAVLLRIGLSIGAYIDSYGGAGIDPRLLAPEVRQSHGHATVDGDGEH